MLTFFRSLIIMLLALKNRVLKILLELLVWIDIGLGLILAFPFYIIFGHPTPNAYETISSVVGKYSLKGYAWARLLEKAIDGLFYVIEGQWDHCKRHIRWYNTEREHEDCD